MSNDIIFITQLGTIIGFIGAVFVLYRILVKQKDSVIELLKEKNSYLQLKLEEKFHQSPDMLVESVSARIKLLTEEIQRLKEDKENNQQIVLKKSEELATSHKELNKLHTQIARAEELMEEFFCPMCKAPMISREFGWESVEHNGREIDVDHEHVLYECGLEFIDGVEGTKCGSL